MTLGEHVKEAEYIDFIESENARLKKNNHDLSQALQACVDVIEPDILRNGEYQKHHQFYYAWKEAKRLLGNEVQEEDV